MINTYKEILFAKKAPSYMLHIAIKSGQKLSRNRVNMH